MVDIGKTQHLTASGQFDMKRLSMHWTPKCQTFFQERVEARKVEQSTHIVKTVSQVSRRKLLVP